MTENPTLQTLTYEKRNRVAVITLNRPEVLNALNRQMLTELAKVFDQASLDGDIAGLILTGAGETAFAAGADIKELAVLRPIEARALARQGHALMDAIEGLGKPVIAAVNGYALGGGCELAMACTVRIAGETAKFGQPEVTLGLIPGYGGTQRLPRLVGKGRALHMILSGRSIDAQEALRIGLVNEVVPPASLLVRAESMLASMTHNAPLALRLALDAVNRGMDSSQANGCTLEAALFAVCAATEDRKEGTGAFLAKRKPAFNGR
jgi:enoyl-CoA hydratase